jgi:lipid-A-disaccharide synthase
MKYYVITGEASGDLHGSNLMRSLKKYDLQAEFRFWGGDLMEKIGGKPVKHYKDLAFMGFVEVAANLRTIMGNIRFCKEDILRYKPDALILIDYPGFNLRIAEFAHKKGFKVFYYISPQVWAWKRSRVHKIKRIIDRMFVILPFEKEFYAKYGLEVEFVGHPLLDALSDAESNAEKKIADDKPVIALLPGSRKQEISRMLPVMLKIISRFPDYHFIVGATSSVDDDYYQRLARGIDFNLSREGTHTLLKRSAAAIVTSGTATLETAIIGIPEVVCYKGNELSYQIARHIVKVPFISLVNLIAEKEIVKELIQKDFNEKNLERELKKVLDPSNSERIKQEYKELRSRLGGSGASDKTAKRIVSLTGK